jgi:hypothetical protein
MPVRGTRRVRFQAVVSELHADHRQILSRLLSIKIQAQADLYKAGPRMVSRFFLTIMYLTHPVSRVYGAAPGRAPLTVFLESRCYSFDAR